MDTAATHGARDLPPQTQITGPQEKSTRAGTRFGRSAWILHGLAYVFFLSAWGVMLLLGETSEDAQPVQGVGGAAALVLSLWSFVLSIRALIVGERPLLPVLNIVLVLIEVTVPCLAAWWPLSLNYRASSPLYDLVIAWGLPVFVPFLTIGTGIAAFFAWWMTKRAERNSAKLEKPAWTRRHRWRIGVTRFAAALLLLAAVGVPLPLYIFAVLSASDQGAGLLQQTVRRVTPDFMKMSLYSSLGDGPKGVGFKEHLLRYGELPDEILLEFMYKDESNCDTAWNIYAERHSEDALKRAVEIAHVPNAFAVASHFSAGKVIGQCGSADEVTDVFLPSNVPFNWLQRGAFFGMRIRERMELLPVLLPLLDCKDLNVRRMTVHVLGQYTNMAHRSTPWPATKFAAETPQELDELEKVRSAARGSLKLSPNAGNKDAAP